MSLKKIVIEVGGKTDLKSTIDQLVKLGVIDEKNAKNFLENSKKTQSAVDQNTKKLGVFNKALSNIGPVLAGAFAVGQITSFAKSVVDITAKFQKFEAVLTNTLGSRSAAQEAMQTIKEFAAATPFSVDELTASYVKLANQGFKPTAEEMRKLGDLAASQSKSFDQLTEAIIDAQTGEFERLKEFGIRASKEGDKVTFTFKGVQKQVDFTNQSIRDYVLSLGNANGVMGGMAAIARTIEGQISNLGDSFDALQVALGERFKGAISAGIAATSDLVQALTELVEVPVSEKLQEEQTELNVLVGAITDVNVSQELRNRLIAELQQKYPDFLANLNAETVTNEQLSARLKEVNDEYFKKIVLQKNEERYKDQLKEQASAFDNLRDAQVKLSEAIEEVNKLTKLQKQENESNVEFASRISDTLNKQLLADPALNGKLQVAIADLSRAQKAYNEEASKSEDILKKNIADEKELNKNQKEDVLLKQQLISETLKSIAASEEEKKKQDDAANSINAYKEKIKALTEEKEKQTNITDKAKLLSLDAEIERYEKLIKDTEEYLKSARRVRDLQKQHTIDFSSPELKDEIKVSKEKRKIRKEESDYFKNLQKDLEKSNKESLDKEVENTKKADDEKRAARQTYTDFAINSIMQVTQALVENSQARIDNEFAALEAQTEQELSNLEKRRDAGIITEKKYQVQREIILKKQEQKEKELRRRQAQQEKEAALFQIAINTAAAVIKGIAQFGPPPSPPGIAAIATAIATGALQAAIVASRPLPAFKEGVIDFKGKGTETSDSNIVRISKGESVIPAEATKKYRDDLQAMIDGTYSKYTLPVISKKSLTEERFEGMAENMAKAIMLQSQFNDSKIVSAIKDTKRSKDADSKLAGMIASKLGDRISENNLFA